MRRIFVAVIIMLAAALAAWAAPTAFERALQAQRSLAEKQPANAAARVDLGNLLLLTGDRAAAEAAYREALRLDPKLVAAHYDLGLLLERRRKAMAALEEFRQVVKLDARHAWAHYRIGQILERRGQHGAAVAAYARAFALDPNLGFPDVNPEVIDSKLTTEALLAAYRSYAAQPVPPVAFADPKRIADLLVPQRPAAAEPQAAPAATSEPGIRPKATFPPAAGSPPGKKSEFFKVLGPADLEPGNRSGQTTPTGPLGVVRPGAYPQPIRQPQIDPDTGEEYDSEEPVFTPPPVYTPPVQREQPRIITPGYVPGVPSSGRLDLRLLPLAGDAPPAPAGR